ncbi:hypothetical protein [Planctomycetes bacterium Pan216]|uniref:ATP dependent DNA ligase n=1 Tax=Kolteria novifilia TaxID=2527975 RepID=UPI0011A7C02F
MACGWYGEIRPSKESPKVERPKPTIADFLLLALGVVVVGLLAFVGRATTPELTVSPMRTFWMWGMIAGGVSIFAAVHVRAFLNLKEHNDQFHWIDMVFRPMSIWWPIIEWFPKTRAQVSFALWGLSAVVIAPLTVGGELLPFVDVRYHDRSSNLEEAMRRSQGGDGPGSASGKGGPGGGRSGGSAKAKAIFRVDIDDEATESGGPGGAGGPQGGPLGEIEKDPQLQRAMAELNERAHANKVTGAGGGTGPGGFGQKVSDGPADGLPPYAVDCVVLGYVPDDQGSVGLVLAASVDGKLHYVGTVRKGLDEKLLDQIRSRFRELSRSRPYLGVPGLQAKWLVPKITCRVRYEKITGSDTLEKPVIEKFTKDL